MSVVNSTGGRIEKGSNCVAHAWAMAASDTYAPIEIPGYADKSVQLSGTFNGSTIVIEGTNQDGADPTILTYATLTDTQGNAVSFTAAGIKQITEICRWIRPRVTVGTPTAVTVNLLAKRTE